jgi:hypothetical protein
MKDGVDVWGAIFKAQWTGVPLGLIRTRVKHDSQIDDWMNLWMLTEQELMPLAREAGWTLLEERRHGPWRVRLFETI